MHVLVTNDDGIDSNFLHTIAHALSKRFRVTVAAPTTERSWIGRAVTRRGVVSIDERPDLPWQAWSIGGTPTDCVSIALTNLLPEKPDLVVSGINIGYNTTTQLIYSSGTVAGALEGAFWGLPAFAVSQEVPDTLFWDAQNNFGRLPADFQELLERHADHAVEQMLPLIEAHGKNGQDAIVHNLNYPASPKDPMDVVRTVPATLREMAFFEKTDCGNTEFFFKHGDPLPSEQLTDREALQSGSVSHSILNFSAIGRDLNH
ncbi:MAG: 5'/3'-nucleotidase SurE [Puniceicoccaceae bacterium]